MVPPTLRSAFLAMAERLSNTPSAWEDTQALLQAEGPVTVVMYVRVHAALGAVRSAYLGTGCLTLQGRAYLALPAHPPPPPENLPRGFRHGRG